MRHGHRRHPGPDTGPPDALAADRVRHPCDVDWVGQALEDAFRIAQAGPVQWVADVYGVLARQRLRHQRHFGHPPAVAARTPGPPHRGARAPARGRARLPRRALSRGCPAGRDPLLLDQAADTRRVYGLIQRATVPRTRRAVVDLERLRAVMSDGEPYPPVWSRTPQACLWALTDPAHRWGGARHVPAGAGSPIRRRSRRRRHQEEDPSHRDKYLLIDRSALIKRFFLRSRTGVDAARCAESRADSSSMPTSKEQGLPTSRAVDRRNSRDRR